MQRLDGRPQHYAWGSRSAIPALLGREPDGQPWAELWFGAHPSAPSRLPDGRQLDRAIDADPSYWLGDDVASRFGARLPYLVKVLAAAEPLSLQAHPSAAQAEAGFARENASGLALDAPERIYRDPFHKPELICALTPFDALCGFRPVQDTVELLRSLVDRGARGLGPFADRLADAVDEPAAALARAVGTMLMMPAVDQRLLVGETAAACDGHDGPWALATHWTVRLADRYRGDVGAVVALLLNCVRLRPGQAIYLGAGNLHAYLGGTGIEVMASSDNVLRGGLTPKHVDVRELLEVLDCTPLDSPVLEPHTTASSELGFDAPAAEFRLTISAPTGDGARRSTVHGPEIVLCTGGAFDHLGPGQAAIVPAADGHWSLAGNGTLFVVGVGDM